MTGRRTALAAAVLIGVLVVFPSAASARGLAGRADLPIPVWLFSVAAALVLLISFAALVGLRTHARVGRRTDPSAIRLPVAVEVIAGFVGVACLALVVYSGVEGTPTPNANFAPSFVYVIGYVGLVAASIVLGDVFALLSPWRALARGMRFVAGQAGVQTGPARHYPPWLGRWPAAAGLLVFAWLDTVYPGGIDPRVVAVFTVAYAGGQLVGMSIYGIDVWSERADAFGVYFNLFSRISPVALDGGAVALRRPLSAIAGVSALPGTVAVLSVMIGATTYDGLTATGALQGLEARVTAFAFDTFDVGLSAARTTGATIALLSGVAVIAFAYLLAVAGMHRVDRAMSATDLARRFAPTLIPIAAAYVLAHSFTLLLYQGQATIALASDPLGRGRDLLGTASLEVDYGILSAEATWYVQVIIVIVGHVAALVLAHDRALAIFGDRRRVLRSQLWMLMVMIAFTSLALWLLASISV